jgi:hypothetical protein
LLQVQHRGRLNFQRPGVDHLKQNTAGITNKLVAQASMHTEFNRLITFGTGHLNQGAFFLEIYRPTGC